jgi:hypothetical protein
MEMREWTMQFAAWAGRNADHLAIWGVRAVYIHTLGGAKKNTFKNGKNEQFYRFE